ncbi:MAG: hypothetical protein V9G20_09200 [Candidatus Promineifilaceae bacterium]
MKRNIYLEDLPLDEAWRRFAAALQSASLWQPLGTETIPLTQALGRVTAEPVWARISAPHYHASAMDGYALRARDTHEATETNPLQLTLAEAWEDIAPGVRPAQAVNTGAPLPIWADTVVMIEHTQKIGASAIEIRASLAPWTHVRPLGEDMVATELVLPANHKLRPVDLGALAGSGHAMVTVYTRPRVAIIPTGSELVSVEAVSREQLTVELERISARSLAVSQTLSLVLALSLLSTHHSAPFPPAKSSNSTPLSWPGRWSSGGAFPPVGRLCRMSGRRLWRR